jgi:hypothetical protein
MNHEKLDLLILFVRGRLAGRVSNLRLLLRDNGLVLQGRAHSYYAKQVAQEVVMKATEVPLLANEIEVLCAPLAKGDES